MKRKITFLLTALLVQWVFSFSALPAFAKSESGWVIEAESKDNYNGVTLANGRIGLVSGMGLFQVNEIVMGGVYDKEFQDGVSRVVRGPLFTNLQMKLDGRRIGDGEVREWKQTLNMKKAFLETSVKVENAQITYSFRALRHLPHMAMVLVEITPDKEMDMNIETGASFPEELQNRSAIFKHLTDGKTESPVYTMRAVSRTGMRELATCSAFMFDGERPAVYAEYGEAHYQSMAFNQHLAKGKTFRFALVGAVCASSDFCKPKDEAERMAVYALQSDIETILSGHEREWNEIWKGDIIIEGDEEAQKDIRLALYNLYSFAAKNTRLSVAPMGLSSVSGYNGHIFWDAEIWMFPPLLMLNQDIARSFLDYRYDKLGKAKQRAVQYGYRGCMYPWESDDSGEEATPTWCLTGPFEHHITADVGIAFWNYYCVTQNKRWLREEGWEVLKAVADYWTSRVTKNEDGSYSILNAVGANEFAQNVDDNAFTNGSAKTVLQYACQAARILGETPDPLWKEVSDNMKFHYMPDGTMKEYATYQGEIIKQADVNLLSYPLGVVSKPARIKQDLDYYSQKIYVDGPAMGNSILSVLYAQIGDGEKAYHYFQKTYLPNKRPPFGVLSESAYSNNPYFCTGAGGLLQAVISGFGGLRITEKGIVQQHPLLPEKWKSLTITGVGPEKKTFTVKR